MTGCRSRLRVVDKLPFRVRKWFAPVNALEYDVPPKLEQYLLATAPELVARILAEDTVSSSVVNGEGFWYLPDTTGTARPLLVAHVDTVGEGRPPRRVEQTAYMLCNPDGILGADDRAGVYAALQLHAQTGVGVLLCDEEESGARGAREAAGSIGPLIQAHPYMIELDRHGHRQVVYYRDECAAFKQHMCSYGFKTEFGTFSDISVLSRELDVPGANVSAGFNLQHSRNEWLDLRTLADVIERVARIIVDNKPIAFTPVERKFAYPWAGLGYMGRREYDWGKKDTVPVVSNVVAVPAAVLTSDDIDSLTDEEIEQMLGGEAGDLTNDETDQLIAAQLQRADDERRLDLEYTRNKDERREQYDDPDKLYAWWAAG